MFCTRGFADEHSLILRPPAPELPVVIERAEHLATRDGLLQQAGNHWSEGRTAEAIQAAEKALEYGREHFGPGSEELIDTLQWLSNVYHLSGNHTAALATSQEQYRLCGICFGQEDWRTVSARWHADYHLRLSALDADQRRKLVEIENEYQRLSAQQEFAAAAEQVGKLIPLEGEAFGLEHPTVANSLAFQAEALNNAGDSAGAEAPARRALEVRERQLGKVHPETADSTSQLGRCLFDQGKYSEAIPLFKNAAAAYTAAQRPVDAAWMFDWIGDVHTEAKHCKEAEHLYEECLRRFEELNDEAALANCYMDLEYLNRIQAKYPQAVQHCLHALEIRKSLHGEYHRDYATSLDDLAWLHSKMGNYVEAELLYTQALEICKKVLGEKTPEYANSLNNLERLA